jgi:hypothetical protein
VSRNNRADWFRTGGYSHSATYITLVLLLLLFSGVAVAQDGNFVITEARSYIDSDQNKILIDAAISYELSTEAIDALHSGVMLTFELEVEMTRVRRFWPDKEIARRRQNYELQFDALSKSYVLRTFYDGEQHSYVSLYAALNDLGHIEGLPIVASEVPDDDTKYFMRMRATLAADKLPSPLQMLAFWRNDFSHGSDWYRWQLSE